jgi:hypothetical protein
MFASIVSMAALAVLAPVSVPSTVSVATAEAVPTDLLVVRTRWNGAPYLPQFQSVEEISVAFQTVSSFFTDASYGNVDLQVEIVGVELPFAKSHYAPGKLGLAMRDALTLAAPLASKPLAEYELHMMLSDIKPGGVGLPGGKSFADQTGLTLVAHELIHSLNVPHSTARSSQNTPFTTCHWDPTAGEYRTEQYNNFFDVTSSAAIWGDKCHPNVRTKNHLGWLPDANVLDVTNDMTGIVLRRQDAELVPGATTALRIHRDAQWDYWVELRQSIDTDPEGCPIPGTNVHDGVLVYLADKNWRYLGPYQWSTAGFEAAALLDMRPGENTCALEFEWIDAALDPGVGLFCEDIAGGQISISVSSPPSEGAILVDVEVPDGVGMSWTPTTNARTLIEFTRPPTHVHTFQPGWVNFRAILMDPDGIAAVEFELYAGGEGPTLVKPPTYYNEAKSEYGTRMNLTGYDGGFTIVVSVTDDDGRKESDGVFFMVTP